MPDDSRQGWYPARTRTTRRVFGVVTATLTASALFVGTAAAWAAENMTLTFVRHGESEGNATGGTTDDNPPLTALGVQQANAVGQALSVNNYDGIYASTLVRTQETARPLAALLYGKSQDDVTVGGPGSDIVVLQGVREVETGALAGFPYEVAAVGLIVPALGWMAGIRSIGIPGSVDGNAFDARMDGAVQYIYDDISDDPDGDGELNAVVFSHGAAISAWVMMNVDNPDPSLILSKGINNTAVVVVEGNPEDGWTLVSWDGTPVAAEPSLPVKMFVNARDLIVTPQTAVYNVQKALETGDQTTISNTLRDSVIDVANAPVKFLSDSAEDIGDAIGDLVPSTLQQPAPADRSAAKAGIDSVAAQFSDKLDAVTSEAKAKLAGKAKAAKELAASNETQRPKANAVRERLQAAANDAGDAVQKSVTKARESVRKAVGARDRGNNKAQQQQDAA